MALKKQQKKKKNNNNENWQIDNKRILEYLKHQQQIAQINTCVILKTRIVMR